MPRPTRPTSSARRLGRSRRTAAVLAVLVVALAGFGLASTAATASESVVRADPPAPPGQQWVYMHTFFDSTAPTDPLEAEGCDGPYGKGNHGCQGRYSAATTTPPFYGAHGTVIWNQMVPSDSFHLNFFMSGAEMRGTVWSPASNTFAVQSIISQHIASGHSGADGDGSPGEKGGPMILGYTDKNCAGTPELATCDASFDIRGWLLITPKAGLGGEAPESTTTTIADPASTTTTATVAAVTSPRFAG